VFVQASELDDNNKKTAYCVISLFSVHYTFKMFNNTGPRSVMAPYFFKLQVELYKNVNKTARNRTFVDSPSLYSNVAKLLILVCVLAILTENFLYFQAHF
jgi:hypothetical protein